jgi:predicted DCC family thiol-disulfide oxidoreductase YuxK
MPHPLVLYDGDCGLCHRFVLFLLARDRRGELRFAPLGSAAGRALLARHGHAARPLDTVCLVLDPGLAGERLLTRSSAVLAILDRLGGAWPAARLLLVVPRPWRDAIYRLLARHRWRLFPPPASCPAPDPAWRDRFLDR